MNKFIEKITNKLNLSKDREEKVAIFLRTVSYYRLLPYIDFIKNNPDIAQTINEINNDKDNWDAVVWLYRYNIKLSNALYIYIYLLETTLKTQVNNLFCEAFGFDWYNDVHVLGRAKKNSIDFLKNKADDYKNNPLTKHPNTMDFVENNTPFGYWATIVGSGNFWNSNDIKLRNLFSANGKQNTALLPLKEISEKLGSINDLRNCLSHHSQVIGCRIGRKGYSKLKLWEVYQNILDLLDYLGCEDINWMIGDLHCNGSERCFGNSFENLYKQYEFIHEYTIKADKLP